MGTETTTDQVIATLAARQYGVVARRQLTTAGLTEREVQRRVAAGHLIRLHRGVYAAGHRQLRQEGWWMAAVLATGRALLSHRDAAALHGIRPPHHGPIDVTASGKRASSRGIRAHQSRVLLRRDAVTVRGIPTTTVARTLADLADVVPPHQLEKALNEAERLKLLDLGALEEVAARTRHRRGPGPAALRQALDRLTREGARVTRSELEDRFLALLDAHDLPRPRTNVTVEGFEVDAHWPQHRLVVELDGWEWHRTRDAFERDHRRTTVLADAGLTVRRFTHRQVADEPDAVAASLRRLLP